MLVEDFAETCRLYGNFEIWDVENMDAFFKGNSVLTTIFEDKYKISIADFNQKRSEIKETNMQIIETVLSYVGDKSFYIFTHHNENHLELIKMQQLKIMNFGVDINNIKNDHVYVVIMDKKLSEVN